MFFPGAVKYGDVPSLLALGAPGKLWLAGESNAGAVKTASAAAGKPDALTVAAEQADPLSAAAWVSK